MEQNEVSEKSNKQQSKLEQTVEVMQHHTAIDSVLPTG